MSDLTDHTARALEVLELFRARERARYGREWTAAEIAAGMVGDVGDLMKLVLAKSGVRDIEDADAKVAHELADILWSVLVLARLYDVDIDEAFTTTMGGLVSALGAERAV